MEPIVTYNNFSRSNIKTSLHGHGNSCGLISFYFKAFDNYRIPRRKGRWMYFEGSNWKVVEKQNNGKKLDILIETENEEEAVKILLS
jgi:hypothetical protein